MSDLASLGLVIVALTLGECAWWVRHGAAVLKVPLFFGAGALRTLSSSLGNERGAFSFQNPLPPFGRAYVLEPWPFSLSEEGVVAARSFSFGSERRPAGPARALRWDEVDKVGRDDATLRVNGSAFAECASRHHAAAAEQVLRAMVDAKAKDRARLLDELLEAHLDPDAIKARTRAHRAASTSSLLASSGLFLALFGAVPFEIGQRGLERWVWLLGVLYAWVALSALATWTAHRELYGKRADKPGATRTERWSQLTLMFLAPYTALRGTDKVGRNLLAGLHPLAAALALAGPKGGRDAVLRGLRDLATPRPLALEPAAAAIEEAFRARALRIARKRAEGRGIDGNALSAPPGLRAGQLAWCPRCRVPYRQAAGTCADCGVALSSAS